jgi:hypothetical protein
MPARSTEIDKAVRELAEKTSHDFEYLTVGDTRSEYCKRCGLSKERTKTIDKHGNEITAPCKGFI